MDLKFWPFYTRILFSGLLLISPTQPSTTKISGIYTLYLYEHNTASESLPTTYDDAIRKCNEKYSRLVVQNESKVKIITDYITGRGHNSFFWVQGRGNGGCSAYGINGKVVKPCNEAHFYICEQAQANSVTLTESKVTISSKSDTITCTASGYPIPHITWKRNNNDISMSDTEPIYQTKLNGKSMLYLKNLNVTDDGEYKCQATNSFGDKMYMSSKSANIKIPSNPLIESVTGYTCNSSLVVAWKPHVRAAEVKHKVTFQEFLSNKDTTIDKTPVRGALQTTTMNNLTANKQYIITIQPACSKLQVCYPYVASRTVITGGVAGKVSNATLRKENGTCKVFWSTPLDLHPNATIEMYQLHIESSLAYVPYGVKVKLSINTTVVNAPSLSYSIPKLPNRNYSVYIQAETCAGLGDKTLTSGKCVTDASAPASFSQPRLQNKNFDIENGTLQIYFPTPSETNGLISCVFIVVNSKYHIEKNNAEYLLRELNVENSTSGTGYIAIAANRKILQSNKTQENYKGILLFTLGDESKTECGMKNKGSNGKQTNDSNNSTDVIRGFNKRLEENKQYQIIIITSTPSGSEVLFQVSKKLDLNYSTIQVTDNSQIILISVGVVVFIAVLLLALYASIRRRKNWRFKEPTKANDVRRSDTGLNNRANSFESFEETEEFPEQFDNETTDIGVVSMSEIVQRIVTPVICKESEKTQPEDPYENYMSDTAVALDELEQYFRKHAEDNNALFFEQYQDIKSKSRENMKSREVASNPDFKRKNRYKNILPFDSTRVILNGNATGYINACYVDGFKQHNKYIATQGPLSSTVVDFWLMVIEQNCKVIIMLAKCTEGGKKKCHKYWPDLDASLTFGSSIVENVNEVKCCGFVRRSFRIYVNNDEREMEVIQYQYLAWPDHGVPFTTSNLVRMQKAVKATIQEADDNSPLLVHCSAGAGRSGTYIGYDILLEEAESQNTIDFYSCVMKMRSQRIDMIQTCDQYILLHKLMLERYTFSETDFPTDGIKSYFQELIRDKYVLSSNFEMLASLVHVETTETNVRNRATIRGDKNYSAQRNVLFIPPEHGEFNPPQIDAFWIEAYDENGFMIAARDPTESTANSFWRGVLYNKANTIIMLSDDQECFQYWPSSIEGNIQIGSVTVTLLEQAIDGAIIERSLKVCGEYGEITVTHFQCTDWDANGCPTNGRSVLKLVEEMRLKIRQNVGYTSLIHCSDGVGRTGTFCTVVNLIDRLKNEGRVDVFSAVKDLRDCKRGMVQTLDQYAFCHQVIIDYLKTFELYSNFE